MPGQAPIADYGDPYDPYCVPLIQPRGFGDLSTGYGANFFGSFQDDGGGSGGSGGGGGGFGVGGGFVPDPIDSFERKNYDYSWYQNTMAQAMPYRDAEVLKKPVIKKEQIALPAR